MLARTSKTNKKEAYRGGKDCMQGESGVRMFGIGRGHMVDQGGNDGLYRSKCEVGPKAGPVHA